MKLQAHNEICSADNRTTEGTSPMPASSEKAIEEAGKSAMCTKLEELEQLRREAIVAHKWKCIEAEAVQWR